MHGVEVAVPYDREAPATLPEIVQVVTEARTGLGGIRNHSHRFAYEVRRPSPEELRVQFVLPGARLERKVRLALDTTVPTASLSTGTTGLPIQAGESLGGGFIRPGRPDYIPFQTTFARPATNQLIATLHPDAMPDTRVVVQILCQPIAGRSLAMRRWQRQARRRATALRQQRKTGDQTRTPSPVDRETARAIDEKLASRRFWTAIRLVIIGAGDATRARLTELKGAFNRYEVASPRQDFDANPLRSVRGKRFRTFGRAVAHLTFDESLRFQATTDEVGALMAVPTRDQRNLESATP